MTVVALCSVKGSPGVTTTSCLVGATWPEARRVVVAECDHAGGDLAARFALTSMVGWPTLASAVRRAGSPVSLAPHLQQLPGGLDVLVGTRHSADPPDDRLMSLFLAGADRPPGRPAGLEALDALAGLDAGGEPGRAKGSFDVVVDLGRMPPGSTGPNALTDCVDSVVLVVRGDAASVMHAADRGPELVARWGDVAGLVVIGSDRYPLSDIENIVGIPVIGELPLDPRAAGVATGALRGDRLLLRSPLTLAASRLAGRLSMQGPSAREVAPSPPEDRRHTGLRPLLAVMARLRRGQSPDAPDAPDAPQAPDAPEAPDRPTPPAVGEGGRSLVDSVQGEAGR